MDEPVDRTRHRRRLIVAMVAVGSLLSTAVIVAIIRNPGETTDDGTRSGHGRRPSSSPQPHHSSVDSWQDLVAMPRTDDPIRYARAVATGLLDWNSMSGLVPDDYANPVLVDADPAGAETNGLLADLRNYLPGIDVWHRLREYETRQRLHIGRAFVPGSWPKIARDAGDQIRPGTVAVTIEATRRREGTWLGESETSAHYVEFTVFLVCKPTYNRCHTLRLSQLDRPLR